MQEGMTSQLVVDALMMAVWRRGKPVALLHHSDQGSQGGFNRSSQHLQPGGVYGATRRMDEAVDWQRRDAISRGTVTSKRGRASVLG
jgi:putative transposase